MKLYEIAHARKSETYPLFSNTKNVTESTPDWLSYYLRHKDYIDSTFIIKYGERDFYNGCCDENDILETYSNILSGHTYANERSWERMWLALTTDYNPLENYERTEQHMTTTTGDTLIKSGIVTDTTSRVGTVTSDNIKSGTYTDDNTKTGVETFAKIGSETTTDTIGSITTTTTDSKAPIDTSNYLDNNKTVTDNTAQTNTSALTFGEGRTDNHAYNDWHDKTEHSFNDYHDTTTVTHDGDKDIKLTEFDNYKEGVNTTVTETINAHGNIGTTRNSEMLEDELRVRATNFYDIIFKQFLFEYFY